MEKITIALGVCGSIAAYKAAALCSSLTKQNFSVQVLMTQSACQLVSPTTFETLSGNRVSDNLFDRNFQWNVQHIALAKRARVFVIAPATANMIAKLAHGIADDMLSSTVLAASCPKLICPAMNTGMYQNPATQDNLSLLKSRGFIVVEPESGRLACGDEGAGRLAEQSQIEDAIMMALEPEKPLQGKRVLITAGGTREHLDPVRYISNHSTGKMGYALAKAARNLGASVTIVSANVMLPPPFSTTVLPVESAKQMAERVLELAPSQDIIIKAAAVSDYTPAEVSTDKIKKGSDALTLRLEKTMDILSEVCRRRLPGQRICGFSMETRELIKNSGEKLQRKGCDMIVANPLNEPGSGFGTDTNRATLCFKDGYKELPQMTKEALARVILSELMSC